MASKSKPKFAVGQVVYNSELDLYGRIVKRHFPARACRPDLDENAWGYWLTPPECDSGGWTGECCLRPLTKRERGPEGDDDAKR